MAIHGKTYTLTNDPSLTAWGWSIVDEQKNIVEAGCIKTEPKHKKNRIRKGDDKIRRISEINNILIDLIKRFDIKLILSELPHGSQNASGAQMVGICAAIPQTLALSFGIPIEWYSEGDAKRAVMNKLGCSKAEMVEAIRVLYGIKLNGFKYVNEAVADSLAVYHAAVKESPTLQYIINQ